MKKRYDIIIIGAGHNGLTAAAYLAKAGKSVLVLEKREVIGGAAATEEIWPGFQVNTGAEDAGMFQDSIVKELFLKMHGLEFRQSDVAIFAPQVDGSFDKLRTGRALALYQDSAKSQESIAAFSERDAERYPAFVQQVNGFTAVLRDMLLHTPPDLGSLNLGELAGWGGMALKLRRSGGTAMMEFMRVLPMPARDYLDEWFESDALKGALGVDAITGTMQGPWSAGTTLQFFYQHINGFLNRRTAVGGIGALSAALASAARQNGAEIRLGAGVAKIQIDNGKAIAVLLENGDQIPANVILSSASPRHTFFEFVGAQEFEPRFVRPARNIIYRGSTAKLILALDELPQFVGQTDQEQLHGRIRISPSLAYIEKAYDAAKHGRFSPNPVLDMSIPTLADPTLAPAGKHILSITVRYTPYHLSESSWQNEREGLVTTVLNTLTPLLTSTPLPLRSSAPPLLLTPADYAHTYSLPEGSIFHGQMGLDQLLVMRPVAGWSQYRTPIENLYLCGAGAHPGGGVTGAPGANAAQALLNVRPR
ncbi:MAG: NAD(P)/FAD-dependent oxidoreductase [Anaerolineae bacterium]|nr:NAD(P)/FAD-dependent oxidoreductase [Anaerolineae bacterium]